jgi:hypothetical protein
MPCTLVQFNSLEGVQPEGFLYGPSPARKVVVLVEESSCIHVSDRLTEPSAAPGYDRARASSPYHTRGLYMDRS